MQDEDKFFETPMRGFELTALIYELPVMLGALLLAGLLALAYAFAVGRLELYQYPGVPGIILAVMDFIALLVVFYAASFYPRRIMVFPDRIKFKMLFSHREIPLSMIDSIETLSVREAKKTFLSPRFHNLSPAVDGAVVMKRTRGRAWVLSPADPEGLIQAVENAREKNAEAPEPE